MPARPRRKALGGHAAVSNPSTGPATREARRVDFVGERCPMRANAGGDMRLLEQPVTLDGCGAGGMRERNGVGLGQWMVSLVILIIYLLYRKYNLIIGLFKVFFMMCYKKTCAIY
jgi:hypothetical protein